MSEIVFTSTIAHQSGICHSRTEVIWLEMFTHCFSKRARRRLVGVVDNGEIFGIDFD